MDRYMSYIYRYGRTISQRNAKDLDLSVTQMRYLRDVCRKPGISQEMISQRHRIDKGTVARAIKKMMALDYIRRENDPNDKRAYKLYPTDKAIAVHEECEAHYAHLQEKILENFTEEEKTEFNRLLQKVAKNLGSMSEEIKIDEEGEIK